MGKKRVGMKDKFKEDEWDFSNERAEVIEDINDIENPDNVKYVSDTEPWHRGPIRIIVSLFLLLIIISWGFSYYAGRIDPSPSKIPLIDDVLSYENITDYINVSERKNVFSREDYVSLIMPDNPIVKNTADRIVSFSCDGSSKVCHAKAVYFFVRDNFVYISDPREHEYVKNPVESLYVKGGDCEDASILLSSLLESLGIRTRLVFVPNHVYVEAYIPDASRRYKQENSWIGLDATCKNCGFGVIL